MTHLVFKAAACAALCTLVACANTAPPSSTPQASNSAASRENCVMLTGSRLCRDPSKVAGDVTVLSPKALREQPTQTNGGLGSLTPSN